MNCHSPNPTTVQTDGHGAGGVGASPVVLVGNSNVGKSVLFGALANRYVTVSNYPGTTVEISQGSLRRGDRTCPVIDTPGIQSIVPFSDDERVTRDILLQTDRATVVQVVDAKNLRRGLLLALELAEAGVSFVFNLNMMDEAEARGIRVDGQRLARRLGVPVSTTVATQGRGVADLVHSLDAACAAGCAPTYPEPIERAIAAVSDYLPPASLAPRALATMWLAGDELVLDRLGLPASEQGALRQIRADAQVEVGEPLAYAINRRRLQVADEIAAEVVERQPASRGWLAWLGRWTMHPVYGWVMLAAVLYAVYQFVGVLGAGTLVDLLEVQVFGEWLNPLLTRLVDALVPFALVRDFLVGEYGLVTMALTYALAIVLPIVTTFFLAFSLLEDSGYLPRLAVLLDRAFRAMGLNGKAVLPMILGLGCDTMATMSTRILETRKERLQVTLLLALAVPCSAQLGVILGMMAGLGPVATLIWLGIVVGSLLAVGYLSARVIPGRRSDFIMELPPLRVPILRNIAIKTVARLEWYLVEVIPIFVVGTAALFVLDKLALLDRIEQFLAPVVVRWLGLPTEVTGAFLVGFMRRDYGATELYSLARDGLLDPTQVLVGIVVITLFMPCFANLLMIVKEYGGRVAAAVSAFVFPFALLVGGVLHWILRMLSLPIG